MIPPALTAEEWELKEFSVGGRDVLFGFQSSLGLLRLGWNGDALRPVENSHPLAALALYGQPFGFTREDVDLIRHVEEVNDSDMYSLSVEKLAQYSSLADRIEALLPPEQRTNVLDGPSSDFTNATWTSPEKR